MVYLDNKKDPQEVWIPRNDGNGYIHTGSSQSYQEGYEDGIEYQKSLLSSSAFTENGEYERENGWSAITVNVEPTLEEINVVISADTTTITPSSGYDGFSAVTVDATEYGQTNYDSGFDDGYNDGYSSGSSEGYDSGYTEGYQSGSTDGFNSGYTSGETHQKSLLVSTAITENGSYQRENGYSAITVNVPTGQTYNIEANHPFLATSNGNYTITPTSASTSVEDEFYIVSGGSSIYQLTATTQGYPYVGTFNLFKVIDSEDQSIGYLDIKLVNGSIYWNSEDWYGGFPHLSGDNVIWFFGGSSSYTWTPLEDFTFSYDVMSAVSLTVNMDTATTYNSGYTDGENHIISTFTAATATTNGVYGSSANPLSSITVNVPTGSSETDIIIVTTGACWFTTNYQIDYGDSIEIEHCTFGTPILPYPGTHQQYVGGNSSEVFRIGQNEYGLYLKYFSNFNSGGHIIYFPSSGSILEDNTITFSSTGFTVDGNVVTSYTTTEISSIATLIFFANNSSGGDVVEKQTAKMGRVKVYASDGTLKATFEPRLDNLNVPYFKYVEQDIDIYASGSVTPLYEILDPMYNSGYTDGYTSGYTDGSASIASLIDRSITSAVIPNGCTKIGSYAFGFCESLSSVTIPNTVTEIGNYAFAWNNFSAITIPSGCTKIGNNAFNYTKLSAITIPNSVTSIGSSAFASCSNLSSVTISNSLTSIGSNAFQYCSSLSSVTIPNSVTSIGSAAFNGCTNLSSITLPSGITKIEQTTFRYCSALTNIYISATTAPTISNANAFQGVPSTGTVHYPQGSDYSSWQSNTYLSGWTFTADL